MIKKIDLTNISRPPTVLSKNDKNEIKAGCHAILPLNRLMISRIGLGVE